MNVVWYRLRVSESQRHTPIKIFPRTPPPPGRPLRKDTIASRDRFRPMVARQNLALYYNTNWNGSAMEQGDTVFIERWPPLWGGGPSWYVTGLLLRIGELASIPS